jgi:hypothetical protein
MFVKYLSAGQLKGKASLPANWTRDKVKVVRHSSCLLEEGCNTLPPGGRAALELFV